MAGSTRRALFGKALTASSAVAVASLPLVANAAIREDQKQAFLRIMSSAHPRGRAAAMHALAAGWDPNDLRAIRSPGGLFTGKDLILSFYNDEKDTACAFNARGACGEW